MTARVRAAIASLHRSIGPPPLRILDSLFGLLDYAALVALCELGIPDALATRLPVDALAAEIHAEHDELDRLVRYAETRGWLRRDRRGRVTPTATTRFLARDHPGGWRCWVDFMSGTEVVAAAGVLADAVRNGGDAFAAANGAPFFDWNGEHPERGAAFDAAMAAGGRMHGIALAKAIDWSDDRLVCDVGGGDGSLLDALLGHQPHLSGVLLDLPAVTARVPPRIARRIAVVGGDAFDAVPSGASSYLLVNIIHDWSDADAARLLGRIAECAPPGSRVIVVERVRRPVPVDDLAHRTDLLMLILAPGGRERTLEEVETLAAAAGLTRETVVRLATGDVAHVLRRADGTSPARSR